MIREMAEELRLIHRDVLDARSRLERLNFRDAVDQQHGWTMGQDLLDFVNV